jgi:hypothetical protein
MKLFKNAIPAKIGSQNMDYRLRENDKNKIIQTKYVYFTITYC